MRQLADRPQIDFEMEFFDALMTRVPDYAEVLAAQASNLTRQGRMTDGLKVDQRLVTLRPRDPHAHYNLACRLALMQRRDQAIHELRRALELGFRDIRGLVRDKDLASIRKDPRFRQLIKDFAPRGR